MHVLYTRPETGGFVVQAALEQAGTDYEIVTIDKEKGDHSTSEFTSLSPLRQVPALMLPDETVITESAAIVIHLGDVFPEAQLCPPPKSPLRPHYLRWVVFCAANLYMADLRFYYADRHTDGPAGAAGIRAAALNDMNQQFQILNAALSGRTCLLGETWSLADIYAAMLAHWHPDAPTLFSACPRLERMCNVVKTLDCVGRANEYHRNLT